LLGTGDLAARQTTLGGAPLTRFVSMSDVRALLTMPTCVELQEAVFVLAARGEAFHSDNAWLRMPEAGGWIKLLSGAIPGRDRAAAKVTVRLPHLPPGANLAGVIVLFDTASGSVRAIVDAVYISALRTGAAAGVASRHLARPDSASVGIIGTGAQARFALAGVCAAVPAIETATVYSRDAENRRRFAEEMAAECGISIEPCADPRSAVASADIVITATNANSAVFEPEWLRPGTHALFLGNKDEVPPSVFVGATIVVDAVDLALTDGKLAAAIESGVLKPEDIHGALGSVIVGDLEGRAGDDDLTIYDCSGLAEQDLICAEYVCDAAQRAEVGQLIDLRPDLLTSAETGS
jgi:alanine dehydrogenase